MGRRLHHFATTVLLAGAVAILCGCQALGQALGQQPTAQAPTVNVVQANAPYGDASGAGRSARTDQSGAVGASGQASQSAEQSLEIPQETIDALIGAAQTLIATGNPAAAAGVLDALHTATAKKPKPGAPAATAPPKPPAAAEPPKPITLPSPSPPQ